MPSFKTEGTMVGNQMSDGYCRITVIDAKYHSLMFVKENGIWRPVSKIFYKNNGEWQSGN